MSIEENPDGTPTTEEVIEATMYTWCSWWGIYDVPGAAAAIDRFVASIKAEALREAAEFVDEFSDEGVIWRGDPENDQTWYQQPIEDYLNTKADEILQGS